MGFVKEQYKNDSITGLRML